jgi:predicted TIM-barrel fold metal-dependent hydrolase
VIVDAHLHAYRSAEEGRAEKTGYPIWEYGAKDGVAFSARDGTVADALEALAEAGASHAAVLEVFTVPGLPFPDGRFWPSSPAFPEHAQALIAGNEWVCSACREHPELVPFVCAHPAVMAAADTVEHVASLDAAGVKLHTIGQRLDPDDPGLRPLFGYCSDRGLPVIAHCGPDRHGRDFATPAAFAPVLERFPGLPLVLAHLGGALWRDVAALASAHASVRFDLSEIISWTGSEHGPSTDELAALVRAIGASRVLFGSDFPWYEPADVVARVSALPGLSEAERELVLGGNAAELLELA